MPAFGVRYALPEVSAGSYLEPVVWYSVSFAGVSCQEEYQQPAVGADFAAQPAGLLVRHVLSEPGYPGELRRSGHRPDWAAVSSVRFQVGRKLTKNLVLSLEVGVPIIKQYPVYDFKTEVRLNLLF